MTNGSAFAKKNNNKINFNSFHNGNNPAATTFDKLELEFYI